MATHVAIDRDLCKSCGYCVDACPQQQLRIGKALNAAGYRVVEVLDERECTACKTCTVVCPEAAIGLESFDLLEAA
ncbi:4Fe-4S dicluster domain-containing protein [Siculibacillus lacustris]|uniref:4Fe-4S dicluster domain-containing protein n=1 Tax=Siculibacillus lacustris TaxID=1549641 RepID=A0A4V2KTX0_9HYPH|nr:4Fe-4S binding protein [Siculibacillus lacustris]TBW38990.1 4Fe-4S dicluster domain-containing protein [Siculibacillus lacustris]